MTRTNLEVFHTENAPLQDAHLSHAVLRYCDIIFASGQIPVDPASGEFAGGDIRNQIRRVMENLSAGPEASGRCLENVVKSTLFMDTIDDFAEFDEAYYEFFRVSHLRDPHSENISQTRLGWRPGSSPW